MSHYKPYPVYKDSGIEWIGEVPEHWKLTRLKWLTELRTDRRNDSPEGYHYIGLEDIEPETGKLKPTGNNSRQSEESTVAVFFCGDVLYGKLRPYLRKAIISGQEGICSTEFLVIRPVSVSPQWLQHWLLTPDVTQQIETGCSGAKMPRTDWEHVSSIFMPNPDLTEQAIIISALDRQTARIDALITKKTRFIELLKEKRQALITHAVTKGLDPNVKMKDSGVEWIGEVPEHWERRKLSHAFAKIGSGTTPPSDQPEWYSDDGIPWVTTGELRESEITKTTKCVTQRALDQFTTLRVYPKGSLAIAMYGATIGRLGILGVAATTNQACCVLSGGKSMTVRFVYYWLLVCKQPIIEIFAAGGGQPNINQEIISGLRVPSPSIDEQDAIAECLDREVAHLDLITEKTQRSIDLLRERRSALITAAVTGKIDLRGSL